MNDPAKAKNTASQKPLNADDLDEEVVRGVHRVVVGNDDVPVREQFARAKINVKKFEAEKAQDEKYLREAERERRLREILKPPPSLDLAGRLFAWGLGLAVVLVVIEFVVALNTAGRSLVWLYLLPFVGVGWLGLIGVQKKEKQLKKHKALMPQTLVLVLPMLERKNPMQAAYCDAVAALLQQQSAWGDATLSVLGDLKTLLQTGRQTAKQRAGIGQAMSYQNIQSIEDEADLLQARLESATDAAARETFQQSHALLQARLERAKSLEPMRQQLTAQEEVVTQALAEVQSALSGASLFQWTGGATSGSAMGTDKGEVPLAYLGGIISRLRQQTETVEQAVRELLKGWTEGQEPERDTKNG